MRFGWLYIVGSALTAFAFTFPLFLAMRQRPLNALRAEGPQRRSSTPTSRPRPRAEAVAGALRGMTMSTARSRGQTAAGPAVRSRRRPRVEAAEGSDYWRTTHYGFVHDDGHALLADWPTDAAVEVSFDTSTLTALYDQAGPPALAGDEHWVEGRPRGLRRRAAPRRRGDERGLGLVARAGSRVGRAGRDDPRQPVGRRRRRGHAAGARRRADGAPCGSRRSTAVRGIRRSDALRADARRPRGAVHAVGLQPADVDLHEDPPAA